MQNTRSGIQQNKETKFYDETVKHGDKINQYHMELH